MTKPLVSVVIPVFDRQKSCLAAIASVQAQREIACEIIVVDDASQEPFVLATESAGPHTVRVLRHQANAGAAAARNTGVQSANGRWIAFLDSDDVWLSGKLVSQIAFAQRGHASGWPKLTCVMCGFRQVSLANGAAQHRIPIDSWDVADFAAGCWFAPGSTALVPADAFAIVGLMDATLPRLEDLDWYLRLALAGGGVSSVPNVLADIYVSNAASASKVDLSAQLLRTKWLSGSSGKLSADVTRNLKAYLALEQAKAQLGSRQYGQFSRSIIESFVLRPDRKSVV